WLTMRPWPGDLQELEMVIARGLLHAGAATITARHLSGEAAAAPSEPVLRPRADGHARVEYLAAEMAHELKNPLVTIKTFADHLPAMLDDAELRTRFAELATESIARMDDLLENVLAFARQGAPRPSAVDMGPLLDAVVAEVEPELAARGVRLDYAGANGARRRADADQLAYALRNLLGGVPREVPPGDALHVDRRAPGVRGSRWGGSRPARAGGGRRGIRSARPDVTAVAVHARAHRARAQRWRAPGAWRRRRTDDARGVPARWRASWWDEWRRLTWS